MAINYATYKQTLKSAMISAREADSIDDALEIMTSAYADALEIVVNQMVVDTIVNTPNQFTGTGKGTIS